MTSAPESTRLAALVETLRRPLADLPDPLPLTPLPGPFETTLRPPGSKSLTNRALVLAALAGGVSRLHRPLRTADDARVMIDGLRRFGALIHEDKDLSGAESLRIEGVAGHPRGAGELDLADAGTAVRFLSAVAGLAVGATVIDGSARMRQRPIDGLVAALRAMKVRVEYLGEYGVPPIRIEPPADGGPLVGGVLRLPAQASSQFISALLMIAPWTAEGLSIELPAPPTSAAYVRMTIDLVQRLGARHASASEDGRTLVVAPGPLRGFDLEIEPDASGATYFWAAAALTPGARIVVRDLTRDSLQGDTGLAHTLARLGAEVEFGAEAIAVRGPARLAGIDADFSDMPDAAMTLAAVSVFADGPTTITGLGTLPIKECDRLASTVTELRKIGVGVTATNDSLTIAPCELPTRTTADPVIFETYRDHRMAMALALVGLRRPNIAVRDPGCVAKTYPTFWRDLARLYESALGRSCPGPPGD